METLRKFVKNRKLLELFNFGVMIVDEDLTVKYWNQWLTKYTKVNQEDIVGKKFTSIFKATDEEYIKDSLHKTAQKQECSILNNSEGYLIPISIDETISLYYEFMQQEVKLYPLENSLFLITIQDHTSYKESEQIGEAQLIVDKLTKLPNRKKLLSEIESKQNKKLALINIDGFAEINDLYGFNTGDNYLIDIALKLEKFAQIYGLMIFKLPSDEYALLSADDRYDRISFTQTIETIIKYIEESHYIDENNRIAIFLSAGVSYEDNNIFRTADIALKNSKKIKNNVVVYDESINIDKINKEKHKWLDILKQAIIQKRLKAFYQPIYNIKTRKIEKYETLIRLIERDGSVISPYFFLNVAKQAKLYNTITHLIIEQSFKMFKNTEYEFSINISVEDIEHIPTVELINNMLKEHPDVASRVVIELLEDEGIENFEMVNNFIKSVKSHGAKIAIDDFGTGYSNFSYLLELDVDYIKIDASLIKNVHENINSRKIVETLVEFSKKMDAKVIGEFVHNKKVLDTITELGIDYAQGFYIDQPRDTIGNEPLWQE